MPIFRLPLHLLSWLTGLFGRFFNRISWPQGCQSRTVPYSSPSPPPEATLPDLSFCGLEDLAGHPSAGGGGVGVRIPGPSDAEARHVNFWHPATADDAMTNDGSQSHPWQTIGFGISQLSAGQGQALYVHREHPSDPSHRSVYVGPINVPLGGAPNRPFWVLGEPGVALEHPAPGPATGPLINVSDAAFVSIVDFELDGDDNVLAYGVNVANSHHVVLDRITIRRHRRSGISISSTEGRTGHDVGVVKCRIMENREPAHPKIEPHGSKWCGTQRASSCIATRPVATRAMGSSSNKASRTSPRCTDRPAPWNPRT